MLNLIDLIVLACYYLFVCFLIMALFGFFTPFWVFLVLVILALILIWLRKRIHFNKKFLWFFILTFLGLAGFAWLRGFFTGDAYWLWLPIGREILINHRLGDFLGGYGYYLSRMPLLMFFFAATFALFNSFNEFWSLWIPFFFTAATLWLVYHWAKEKGLSQKLLFFVPVLFLANNLVAFSGWNLMQEAMLLFFATAFFYYYERTLTDFQKKDLLFLLFSFVLAVASKIIGLFLILWIIWLFFRQRDKKRILAYSFVVFTPIIFWLIRNYLVYDNPFFPLLAGLFKGRYYQPLINSYFPGYLKTDQGWLSIFASVAKFIWLGLPFVLLSFYGFIKKRSYSYLIFFFLFFFLKETFYFTTTISVIRYYYLFLGLFLVYALVGLEKIKSKSALGGLIILALAGLLLLPVTDSASLFISSLESKFSLMGSLVYYLHNYWFLVLLFFLPFVYLALKRPGVKIFLIFIYSLYILHLKFVFNKSWLNVWPFVLLALAFLVLFSLRPRIKQLKWIILAFVVLTVLVNSWLMALVYYWHQGNFTLPVAHIWEKSRWAHQILNEQTNSQEREEFYVLIAEQPDYFNWWTDYQALNLFDFDFWKVLRDYKTEMTAGELADLFRLNKVRYIVKNGTDKHRFGDKSNTEFDDLFNKIKDSDKFKLLGSRDDKYFVWQVY